MLKQFFRIRSYSAKHYCIFNHIKPTSQVKSAVRCIYISPCSFANPETSIPKTLDREKKLKVLELEAEVLRQEGRRVPDPQNIQANQWEELLKLETRSARCRYYAFLYHIEKKKESKEMKKLKNKEEIQKRKEEEKAKNEQNNHIIYGLSHTGFLLRVYDTTINHWNNNRLIQAIQFGQKIVLDCSYDDHMNTKEAVNAAKQLMLCFAENRSHDDPFDMHFCNVNMNSTTMKHLMRHIPTLRDPSFPLNVHEECFTEIFPKKNLVYLTPHCKTELMEYNPDDVYIIGAMVDKGSKEPLSLAKAKRLGLRMAKLPLNHYLQWGSGSGKSLTLNQVVSILLDVNKTGDWQYSLRHVPRRKIVDLNDEASVDRQQRKRTKTLRARAELFDFNIDSWGSNRDRSVKRQS